jgi:hypothetical protein
MPGGTAVTDPATPASLRWVIPSTVVGVLVLLGAFLAMQHDRRAEFSIDATEVGVGASAFSQWLTRTTPLMTSLRTAFDDAGKAAAASDFAATGAACRAGLGATGALVAEFPSPDARLDRPLRQAIGDYDEALRHCVSGSEHADPAELAAAADLVAAGDRNWRAAVELIDPDWPGLAPRGPSHVFKT